MEPLIEDKEDISATSTADPSEERYFLEGPHTRKRELIFLQDVLLEFIRGFRTLHFVGPCVTVLGPPGLQNNIRHIKKQELQVTHYPGLASQS